jgi:hypothetical protein
MKRIYWHIGASLVRAGTKKQGYDLQIGEKLPSRLDLEGFAKSSIESVAFPSEMDIKIKA